MSQGTITIRQGREKSIMRQHPWIFSGAIDKAQGAAPGDIVTVLAHDGSFLARGYWNPSSQIQVRILTWHDEPITENWWQQMLRRAIFSRRQTHHPQADDTSPYAYRLVNAENDFLPGLIVDRYGDWLVLQALTLHIDQQKDTIARLLSELLPVRGIYERSDIDVRGKEGLKPQTGLLWGDAPPALITISESVNMLVDVRNGHKTGFYLDQRDNRYRAVDVVNDYDGDIRMLNLFCYTGGFSISASMLGGIHTVNVDSSADAISLARRNYEHNGFHLSQNATTAQFIQADAFTYLRQALAQGEQFDIIICDPPKFAHTRQQVDRAARGYKDINLHCFRLLKPGGHLMTFSCSGAISADLFQKIVFGALVDSGRQAQIIRHLGPAEDHPVALTFPEGAYLKGLLLRVY
jgi:23S rRNA (cytosine1962-C5)-methyltransferase